MKIKEIGQRGALIPKRHLDAPQRGHAQFTDSYHVAGSERHNTPRTQTLPSHGKRQTDLLG